jgi:predicted enzyme related to lactoylglutathione lyase
MDLDAGMAPPGTPPATGVLVRVDDAAATVAKAVALGGKADPPVDVRTNGRMALLTDPNGALLGLWEPRSKEGFTCDRHAHGAPTWFETITSDDARAVAFYRALFGWTAEAQHPTAGMTYHVLSLDGAPIGGVMTKNAHLPDVPPHWGTTFCVRDADAAVARGAALGGKVCIPVHELTGVARFALLQSPQGVSFHLVQWAR